MNKTETLFPPAHRATDPPTSEMAEREINKKGIRKNQCAMVLVALQLFNGSTSRELAHYAGLDRYMVAKRLPDLRRRDKVKNCSGSCSYISCGLCNFAEIRTCKIGKRKAITWWLR